MLSDRINALIDDAIYLERAWDSPREYLGISVVGHPCDRHVQYQFLSTSRKIEVPSFEPRTLRIFDRGHIYEAKSKEWLKRCGFIFYHDPAAISDFGGKLQGHVDGVIIGFTQANPPIPFPALWENKCLGAKSWKQLEKHGLKEFSPAYWSQVHTYMGYFDLLRCLFTAVNADTMEMMHLLIDFDATEFDMTKAKATRVFQATDLGELLPKITADPSFYLCGYCPFRIPCWK